MSKKTEKHSDICPVCGGKLSSFLSPLSEGTKMPKIDQNCLNCGLIYEFWPVVQDLQEVADNGNERS